MFHGIWKEMEIKNHRKLISKKFFSFIFLIENSLISREERDRLRIAKQDPLNHMSKYVDGLKRKREDQPKPSTNTKKSSSSFSTSSSSRIEQLRAAR